MFRLTLAALAVALALGLACEGDECDASTLLQTDRMVPKVLKGCAHGIQCKSGSCRCAEPGEVKRMTWKKIKKGKRETPTPATAQGGPKSAGEAGCMGKSIFCKASKNEANCKFWKGVGCSWGHASLVQDYPTGCSHGIQCNEDGCRCALPGQVKQVTEEILEKPEAADPEAPAQPMPAMPAVESAGDSCLGTSILCKHLETEEHCKFYQSEGCAWGKAALVQKARPKGCKHGMTCRNGNCRCAKPAKRRATIPEAGSCTGSSPICAAITSEKFCTDLAKANGCSWSKTSSLIEIKELQGDH